MHDTPSHTWLFGSCTLPSCILGMRGFIDSAKPMQLLCLCDVVVSQVYTCFNEKEGRKNQARSNNQQQGKQHSTPKASY